MTASSVADVYQSLKASLDMFKVAAAENVDVPSKQVIVQAAEQVKNDAAKSECRQTAGCNHLLHPHA